MNGRLENQIVKLGYSVRILVILATLILSVAAHSKQTVDVEALEAKAREASIDRFKEFMQDKNIQTIPKGPDGKPIKGKTKLTANKDDKNPFESDLTYHDTVKDKYVKEKDPKPGNPDNFKLVREKAFKSPHGKLSAAGGSSALERKSEEVDEKFEKADEKDRKKPEEGISYDGMFKNEVREVKDKDIQKKPGGSGAPIDQAQAKPQGSDDPEDDVVAVSRKSIREEAVDEFKEVGTNSAQTIIQSARDPDKKTDEKQLANGVLLRVAAAENLMALWRSTLSNLTQRREGKAVPPLENGTGVEMDEDVPNCKEWSARAEQKIAEAPKDKQESLRKDLKQMTGQCEEIASLPYNQINPRYIVEEGSDAYKLSFEGVKKEDGVERDSRAQLEVMAQAGKSATSVESNWKYDAKDDQVTLKRYQEDGSTEEITTTVAEEIESYNNQLREAKKGYDKAKNRLGNFTPPDPTKYEIEAESKSMMEISQAPGTAMEDYGVKNSPGSLNGQTAPNSYQELQNQP